MSILQSNHLITVLAFRQRPCSGTSSTAARSRCGFWHPCPATAWCRRARCHPWGHSHGSVVHILGSFALLWIKVLFTSVRVHFSASRAIPSAVEAALGVGEGYIWGVL